MYSGSYPLKRLRRLRTSSFIRDLVQEHRISSKDLVYPIFVVEGNGIESQLELLPGQYQYSIDKVLNIVEQCEKYGIVGIALFPKIDTYKLNPLASESYNPNGLVPSVIRLIKKNFPNLGIFSDVALDPYTDSGMDGIVDSSGYVINDKTNHILIKQALCHAEAGVDFVCPSDSMDGRILLIRNQLEQQHFHNTGIMSYVVKFSSNLYGPFRSAVGSAQNLGNKDKKSFQTNPANVNEALHEAFLDIQEGADILMVKPGMMYLDVLYRIKHEFKKPTASYNVSGEYCFLKNSNWLNYSDAILESMLCFKRAGADFIWTYSALDVAKILYHDKLN